ncbi:MAG: Cof-type HAD-IIB family hydrolase [Clostridiales Family XIII bacterium]|jgi:Cof subfamily protein (haloacid dehalogenase superfamily)|nr:Cof-type HAD-IIB family hydrolase [Clostridiales Family XIII bacterium]
MDRIELIAIDIDGTLVDHSNGSTIAEADRAAIAEAQARGIHVVLASGRGYDGAALYNRELGIRGYTIASVGAHVADAGGQIVFATHIDPAVTREILTGAARRGIHFHAYLDDRFYYLEPNEYTAQYEAQLGYAGAADPDLLAKELRAAKLLLVAEPDEILRIRSELEARYPGLAFGSSAPFFLEIIDGAANKGRALAFVAGQLGVPAGRIMAIGDSDIDISMLRFAGVGVAVKSADPALKAEADYVCTGERGEPGIAEAIRVFAS